MRYLLDQKDNLILDNIQNLFGFGKVTLRSKTDGVFRYTATGFKSMYIIISYFKLFPLKTNKSNSLEKFSKIHDIIYKKLHLTKEGLNNVKVLQKQININNSIVEKTGSANP
jgi:hypothetical protein